MWSWKTFILLCLALSFVLAHQEGITPILRLANFVCVMIKELMPFVVILLIVFAGIAYVVGPVFGAEMKGRATSWAASMIVGAIIGILIFVAAKPAVQMMMPEAAVEDFCTREFGIVRVNETNVSKAGNSSAASSILP